MVDHKYDFSRRSVEKVLSVVADVRGTVRYIRTNRSTSPSIVLGNLHVLNKSHTVLTAVTRLIPMLCFLLAVLTTSGSIDSRTVRA